MTPNKFELLREALPYIQRFKNKIFVVKLSGKITEDKENLAALSEEIALLNQVGIKICVIHGGGKQLTELAQKLGVTQTIVGGRRVTDDETLELAKMIFAGKINTDILASFRKRGIHAVGLSGIDGNIINAKKRLPQEVRDVAEGSSVMVDFGNVGEIIEINTELLSLLLDAHYLPVVSSLGADSNGDVFNINADTIAAEVAARLNAEKLIVLSDVNGIYLDSSNAESKISVLTKEDAQELIESGKATGGMIPKLESFLRLLESGVNSIHVINGNLRNSLLMEVFTDTGTGTMIVETKKGTS
ncbi:MAG: acetylglutamate kinase [Pyrinomonadaceae bacterium]